MEHHAAVDRVHLAALRALTWADVTGPLERAAVLAAVVRRLDDMADEQARVAAVTGETMGAVGRALGISRSAAWRRYAAAAEQDAA